MAQIKAGTDVVPAFKHVWLPDRGSNQGPSDGLGETIYVKIYGAKPGCFIHSASNRSWHGSHAREGVAESRLLGLTPVEIQRFHLLACPRCASQELEAGSDAGVMGKASDINLSAQRGPTIDADQLIEHVFERDAVQWILGLDSAHWLIARILSSFSTTA